jgi:hypothetical protein
MLKMGLVPNYALIVTVIRLPEGMEENPEICVVLGKGRE